MSDIVTTTPPTVQELEAEAAALEAEAQALKAQEPPVGPQVTLSVVEFWISSFVSGVGGVKPITPAGTAVPAESADAVIEAGRLAGVTIERR